MRSVRRRFAAFVLGVAVIARSAAATELPPLDGEFSGDLKALALPGAPPLHWTLTLTTPAPDQRVVNAVIRGAGTQLQLQMELNAATGDGTWTLSEGELNAAAWLPALAAQVGSAADGILVEGTIALTGKGEWRDGIPTGVITMTWRNGRVYHPEQDWSLNDVTMTGDFFVDGANATVRSEGPFELTVGTVTTTRFGARALLVRAVLDESPALSLREAQIEIAGGIVTLDPATIPLAPPAFELSLRITNVGLQDVAALLPAGLSESRGRINGMVRAAWSEAEGFQLGEGHLELGETEPASLRLAPTPGFLTERVPEYFELVPSWLGPVARWFRPENPAYADLQEIELGRRELRIETLSVQLTPEGDEQGRTARVRIKARPTQPGGAVGELTFEVNVVGPLREVLRLGLNENFTLGFQ